MKMTDAEIAAMGARMTAWLYLHDSTDAVHLGQPTDARGLRLRQECGYTYVDMGRGWMQIGMAAYQLGRRGEAMAVPA
jgi:hypothetical protein